MTTLNKTFAYKFAIILIIALLPLIYCKNIENEHKNGKLNTKKHNKKLSFHKDEKKDHNEDIDQRQLFAGYREAFITKERANKLRLNEKNFNDDNLDDIIKHKDIIYDKKYFDYLPMEQNGGITEKKLYSDDELISDKLKELPRVNSRRFKRGAYSPYIQQRQAYQTIQATNNFLNNERLHATVTLFIPTSLDRQHHNNNNYNNNNNNNNNIYKNNNNRPYIAPFYLPPYNYQRPYYNVPSPPNNPAQENPDVDNRFSFPTEEEDSYLNRPNQNNGQSVQSYQNRIVFANSADDIILQNLFNSRPSAPTRRPSFNGGDMIFSGEVPIQEIVRETTRSPPRTSAPPLLHGNEDDDANEKPQIISTTPRPTRPTAPRSAPRQQTINRFASVPVRRGNVENALRPIYYNLSKRDSSRASFLSAEEQLPIIDKLITISTTKATTPTTSTTTTTTTKPPTTPTTPTTPTSTTARTTTRTALISNYYDYDDYPQLSDDYEEDEKEENSKGPKVTLSSCEIAILNCCKRSILTYRTSCFEHNNCDKFFVDTNPCSENILDDVLIKYNKYLSQNN